jgi:hypothetical protein
MILNGREVKSRQVDLLFRMLKCRTQDGAGADSQVSGLVILWVETRN